MACSECGAEKVLARGLCSRDYNRRWHRGEFRTQAKDMDDLDPAQMRELLAEHLCPLCCDGPFEFVLSHAQKAHGVAARDIKRRAELNLKSGFVSDELRDRFRDGVLPEWVEAGKSNLDRYRAKAVDAAARRSKDEPTELQKQQPIRHPRHLAQFMALSYEDRVHLLAGLNDAPVEAS